MGVKGAKERGASMREIDKNEISFRPVESTLNISQHAETAPGVESSDANAVTGTNDLSLAPEAVIGRSQVQFSGKNSGIDNDMNIMMANPNAVYNANTFFDNAYEQLKKAGDTNAYEKAAKLTELYQKEFLD